MYAHHWGNKPLNANTIIKIPNAQFTRVQSSRPANPIVCPTARTAFFTGDAGITCVWGTVGSSRKE